MIKVLFFAQVKEKLGLESIQVEAQPNLDIATLKQNLANKGDEWSNVFATGSLLSSLNHTIVDNKTPINDGDEVAFFPPVTGG